MWSGMGLALCCILLAVAGWKSRGGSANYYERDVYMMSSRTHRAYALVSVAFACLFALSYAYGAIPVIPLLGAYTLVFIFYFSSFARGFSDQD